MLSKLKPKDQTVNCPQCQSVVYVPVKFEKKIKVTCKKCRFRFELQLNNPLTQNMKLKTTNTRFQNFKEVLLGLNALPWSAKALIFVLFIAVIGILYLILLLISSIAPIIYTFIKGFFSK